MEQKKSDKANLENKRTSRFLIGLAIALAMLFGALEYRSPAGDLDIDERLLDDVAEELLVNAWEDKDQMVAVVEEPQQPAASDQIKVVETLPELPKEAEQTLLATTIGDVEDLGTKSNSEPLPPVATTLDNQPVDFRIVEQLPEFPGGMTMFMQWLTKNLKYPQDAQEIKLQGKVVVSFIVNRDGSITDAKVVHSVNPSLDNEAMRVIRMMPRWKPGIQNNQPCRTMIAVPIVFEL